MLGIQVFNLPNNFIFFKEECVEFNYRWLTEGLEIDSDEITFIEDVWAGGGNLGPSIEYFVRGLELGNMVFMQFKTFHDGRREELPVKVIDVGIGLERFPWLLNGSATSYVDTFSEALVYLSGILGISINTEVWEKFGPYSCLLNIDEVTNIDKTWEEISEKIGIQVEDLKKAISPVKDMYVILDHTRTIFITIYDGSLPSNVGGGSNVRNIFRRVLALLHKNKWWDKVGLEGLLEIMEYHKKDLEKIYGKFTKNTSLRSVLGLEIEKWNTTDKDQKSKLDKLLKKSKGVLTLDDWIIGMQSWGIPADRISEISGISIPGNLYLEIAERLERTVKATEVILYDTTHLDETDNIFYKDNHQDKFEGRIVDLFINLDKTHTNKQNIVILNKSLFYPTSGGQQHDIGELIIKGETYSVINVEKVGKCSLHILDRELPGDKSEYIGEVVYGLVDIRRRKQLMSHHTGTHVVFAAARKVLSYINLDFGPPCMAKWS